MNKLEQSIKRDCDLYMYRNDLYNDFELAVIYYKPDDKMDSFAYIVDSHNAEEIQRIEPYSQEAPWNMPNWDYNIDTYDFENLQEGYEIAYMSMDTHHGFWCTLEQWMPDEIDNMEGLQKYLTHCKKNGITKQVIEYATGLKLKEDALQYYVEENQGYEIIATCNINGRCTFLAESKTAPTPYVTWIGSADCKEYTSGHYFASLENAEKDYMKRAHGELHYIVEHQVHLPKMSEKGQER